MGSMTNRHKYISEKPKWTFLANPILKSKIKSLGYSKNLSSSSYYWNKETRGEPGVSKVALVVKNPPANTGDIRDSGSIAGLWRSPGGGHSNPLRYSCLENPIDRGTWWATVHRVAKSQIRLKRLSMHARTVTSPWLSTYSNLIFFSLSDLSLA